MAKGKTPYYPPVNFFFRVIFHGAGIKGETSFQEVSGLNVSIGTEEVKEGGLLGYTHKLPTNVNYTNLQLKRGLVPNSGVQKWIEAAVNEFKFTPITVSIQLLNEKDQPIMTWVADNAWPVKWEISRFNSQSNEVVLETLEIAYNSLKVVAGK